MVSSFKPDNKLINFKVELVMSSNGQYRLFFLMRMKESRKFVYSEKELKLLAEEFILGVEYPYELINTPCCDL
jgi:hypothetical protein